MAVNLINSDDTVIGQISDDIQINFSTDRINEIEAIKNDVNQLKNDTGWVDLQLLNGVTARSDEFAYKPQIRKIDKVVCVKGQISIPSHTGGLIAFKIPNEFMPNYEVRSPFLVAGNWLDLDGNFIIGGDETPRSNQSLDMMWFI